MKRKCWIFAPILATAVVIHAAIPPGPPNLPWIPPAPPGIRVVEVRPAEVCPGEFATAYGVGLEAANVKEVWLVQGEAMFRMDIMEQTAHAILFRLPGWVPEGRWQIALLAGHEMLVEQHVYLRVKPHRGPPTG